MREMTGENKEHLFHKVNMVANLENGNTANYKEIMSTRESKKVFYPGDSRATLVDILEVLASFDEYGIFLNHLQDPSSSNFSDIHKNPMGFSMMRKKIESQDYTSWKSFVDDFEHVCYDAMSYYRKHAALWNAANDMLHKGSAYMDEMAEKTDGFLASFFKAEQNVAQELDASNNGDGTRGKTVIFEVNHNNSKCNTDFTCGGSPENVSIQPVGKKNVQQLEIDATFNFPTVERSLDLLCSKPCARSLGNIQGLLKNRSTSDISLYNTRGSIVEADDTVVDIIRCVEDDVRFDSPEQATESSSSFGETDIDDDYKETNGLGLSKPQLCNGNVAAPVMEDHDHVSTKRVSDGWKSYSHGIEWRCRWLELQFKEFQSRISCYKQKLKEIHAKKLGKDQAHFIKAPAARAASLICHYQRQRILHRKRKKVRDVENLSTYMSQHPVFSLYEIRNRVEVDGRPVDDDFHCIPGELKSSISDESNFNGQLGQAGATSENSVELMLWKIENLQSRITKMKNRLNKLACGKLGKIFTKRLAPNSLSTGPPKGAVQATVGPSSHQSRIHMCVGGGSKVQSGSSLSRRRISEFDINNIIMPGNTMATYVEPLRHAFIEIPRWNLVDETITLDKSGRKNSSEEATDDEVYTKRHKDMEIKEKHLRGFPHPARKCPASSNNFGNFGKGTMIRPLQSLVTEKEICTRSAQGNELPSNCFPWEISIPKGKRKGKRSRPSFVQVVEVAHAAELEDATMTPNDGREMC